MVSGGVGVLAYPWEFLLQPDAAGVLAGSGAAGVAVAGAYHAVRVLRPPGRPPRVLDLPSAARYWRPAGGRYPERLTPPSPPAAWAGSAEAAVASCRAAGLPAGAWLSVLHATALASAAPDLALVNCYGDRYRHALCPSRPEAADYASALVGEALRALEPDWLELEATGFHGYRHDSLHDKAGVTVDDELARLLSICFCPGCRRAQAAAGLDPDRAAAVVAAWADDLLAAAPTGRRPDPLDERSSLLAAVLEVRAGIVTALLGRLVAQCRAAGIAVAQHAGLPAGTVGSRVPLATALAAGVDAVVLTTDALPPVVAAADVAAAVRQAAGEASVLAGVRGFPPDVRSAADLATRLTGAAVAGAAGARLHTYGLIGATQLGWLATTGWPGEGS